jgi:hypothetical protein
LERTAARFEPNLRRTRHWPNRYRAPIGRALAQARQVAQGIPSPVTLAREDWIKDPFVHALFASTEEMHRAIAASPTISEFVAGHGGGEVHALLSLRREVKTGFGTEASGEVLRRDVPQRVVWFTDPHFIGPAADETEVRENLLWAMFDRFLDRLAVGIARIHAEQERLIQEKDQAQARLRGASPAQRPGLEAALNIILKRLGEIGDNLDPARSYEVFETVFSHPEDCLFLEQHPLALDTLGVVQADSGARPVTTLHFIDLLERYQSPRCVVLVRCSDVKPSSVGERLAEAHHWL